MTCKRRVTEPLETLHGRLTTYEKIAPRLDRRDSAGRTTAERVAEYARRLDETLAIMLVGLEDTFDRFLDVQMSAPCSRPAPPPPEPEYGLWNDSAKCWLSSLGGGGYGSEQRMRECLAALSGDKARSYAVRRVGPDGEPVGP